MVNVHAEVQLSIGHTTLSGVVDLDTKYQLPQLTDADRLREPTQAMVRDILGMMKMGSKEKKI